MKILGSQIEKGMTIRVASIYKMFSDNTNKGVELSVNIGKIGKKSQVLQIADVIEGNQEGHANGGAGRITWVGTKILVTDHGKIQVSYRQKVEVI